MKVIESVQEFDEVLKNNTSVFVDFFADWCGPCKAAAPLLEEIEKDNPSIKMVKVNVDNLPDLASRYDIMSIPAMFAIKNGEVVKNQVGLAPKPQLEELVKSAL